MLSLPDTHLAPRCKGLGPRARCLVPEVGRTDAHGYANTMIHRTKRLGIERVDQLRLINTQVKGCIEPQGV